MPQEPEDELLSCRNDNKLIKYIAGTIAAVVTAGILSIWQTIQTNNEKLVRLEEKTSGIVGQLDQLNEKIDSVYTNNETELKQLENRVHVLETSQKNP